MKLKWHTISTISNTTYFNRQRDMAEFLGIKSADRKSIRRVALRDGYEVEFDDY